MKKSLIALAALSAASAFAQSSVTVYGRFDAGFTRDSGGLAGASSVSRLDSGIAGGSRLGFRGVEDLGSGLKANFVMETGFCGDSNANAGSSSAAPSGSANGGAAGFCTGGNAFMGREARVGLSGGFGSLDLGRQYTPAFVVLNTLDPFGTGTAGQITNLFDSTGGYGVAGANSANPRMNNTVKFSTANFGGFTASIGYGFGEVANNSSAGRSTGLNAQYSNGPIYVGFGYHIAKNNTNTDERKNALVGATYDFGPAKAHFAYGTTKNAIAQLAIVTPPTAAANINNGNGRNVMLGVSAPLGAGRLMASYIRHDDKGVNNFDADQLGIGYSYALSKRTSLYTAYAKINNKNGSFYTVGNAGNGGIGNSAFNLGVAHTF